MFHRDQFSAHYCLLFTFCLSDKLFAAMVFNSWKGQKGLYGGRKSGHTGGLSWLLAVFKACTFISSLNWVCTSFNSNRSARKIWCDCASSLQIAWTSLWHSGLGVTVPLRWCEEVSFHCVLYNWNLVELRTSMRSSNRHWRWSGLSHGGWRWVT